MGRRGGGSNSKIFLIVAGVIALGIGVGAVLVVRRNQSAPYRIKKLKAEVSVHVRRGKPELAAKKLEELLAIDPDERYEARLAAKIDRLVRADGRVACTFRLREMYEPDVYRVDGLWGRKRQARLLHIADGFDRPKDGLHQPWAAFLPDARLRHTAINLYHLKMIDPRRRRARAALYNHLDPDGDMQELGYDYLADDTDASLERIPCRRAYRPPHREDGGLWMPAVEPTGEGGTQPGE